MIIKIKDKLRGNSEQILKILHTLQFHNIREIKDSFNFGFNDDGKGTGNFININTLSFNSFSGHGKGDIITLVAERLNISNGKAIRWLCDELNLTFKYIQRDVKLPFGGFFKNYSRVIESDDSPPPVYNISKLDTYIYGVSKLWIDDGISAITQELFGVGYDLLTNRITYPWVNEVGELIGLMGRLNTQHIEEWQNRYMPIIPFNKSKALYGLYENYKDILKANTIIICESEKSVLKALEYGFKNVVALGCKNISQRQARLIKSMYCNVILALDEGIDLQYCIEQANKVQISNPFFSNEVYVLDTAGLEDKSCVFDSNLKTINEYLTNKLIYIDKG